MIYETINRLADRQKYDKRAIHKLEVIFVVMLILTTDLYDDMFIRLICLLEDALLVYRSNSQFH